MVSSPRRRDRCPEPCQASCVEDTTDEAPPLKETFANLVAIWLGHELFAVAQDPLNCEYLEKVSLGENRRPHNALCRDSGKKYPHLVRDDDESCDDSDASTDVCDKPSLPGFDDNVEPTGACNDSRGYDVDSMFQTLWELLHEENCSETQPYTCTPLTALPQAGDPGEIHGGSLLYAARLNSMTYKGFIGDMGVYIACNFGESAYLEWLAVACHHSLLSCELAVPLSCEVCGDFDRQGGEACDGTDLGGATCETLGFDDGLLLCNASCGFDTSQCTTNTTSGTDTGTPGTGTTAGTASTTDDESSSSMGENSATTTGGSDPGGCGCTQTPSAPAWMVWLLAAGLLRRRPAALVLCAGALGGVGCSPKDDHDTGATSPSTGEPNTTGTGTTAATTGATVGTGTMTGAGTTSTPVPAQLFGTFHSESYTDGQKWEQETDGVIWWSNVTINADSTLSLEYHSCGELVEVQSFSWEADGDSLRVVPPGVPFKWAGSEVVEITIEPGESCGEILITSVTPTDQSFTGTWVPGRLCPFNSQSNACTFEFKWCESPPEPPMCG